MQHKHGVLPANFKQNPKSRYRDYSTSNTCTRDIKSVNKTTIFDLNDILLMTG